MTLRSSALVTMYSIRSCVFAAVAAVTLVMPRVAQVFTRRNADEQWCVLARTFTRAKTCVNEKLDNAGSERKRLPKRPTEASLINLLSGDGL